MSKPTYCLLDEHLIGIQGDGTRKHVTLPEVLARLSRGEPTELTALQAYQQHAWHAFTVQLAAIAIARAELEEPVRDAGAWRKLLVDAAEHDGGGEEAFCLVVGDLSKPAFLQPPVPEGTLAALKTEHTKPSAELDVLITSKNHDLKVDRLATPTPEHWMLSLVMLQTMQGFLGAGNYGIARMNGGFSSRPCVAFAPAQAAAPRFLRDLAALLRDRPKLLERYSATGPGLLWCLPWDGTTSLPLRTLDPYFIEVCRRIRLFLKDGKIVARRASSKVARVNAADTNGNTRDPWTPVSGKDNRALTLSEAGLTYDRVQDLMFGDWSSGSAGTLNDAGDHYWLGQALVRGQGKTGGYHERWLPVPGKVRSFFASPDGRERMAKRAQEWVELASRTRLKILKPAILTLLQGAPDKLQFDDDRAEPFLASLNQEIDGLFFPMLFDLAEADPEEANTAFGRKLARLSEGQFRRAIGSVPLRSATRYRAIAHAERAFWGALKTLPGVRNASAPPGTEPITAAAEGANS